MELTSISAQQLLHNAIVYVGYQKKRTYDISKRLVAGPPGIEPGTPGFPCEVCRLKARCSVLTELRALLGLTFQALELRVRCFLVFRFD